MPQQGHTFIQSWIANILPLHVNTYGGVISLSAQWMSIYINFVKNMVVAGCDFIVLQFLHH